MFKWIFTNKHTLHFYIYYNVAEKFIVSIAGIGEI